MQAIQGLIGTEVGGFQTNIDITQRMVKDYPDLFPNLMDFNRPIPPTPPLTDKERAALPRQVRGVARRMERMAQKLEKHPPAKRRHKSAA